LACCRRQRATPRVVETWQSKAVGQGMGDERVAGGVAVKPIL
jgi:hypothetical protein